MLLYDIFLIATGFAAISLSARHAMKSVVAISRHLKIPEFTISFLLVGLISILPELSIGINSALSGSPTFGLGVVLGSNIADLTLVIGLVAIAAGTLSVDRFVLRQSGVLLLLISFPVLTLLDGEISRLDGLFLVGCFLAYVAWLILIRRNEEKSVHIKADVPKELFILLVSVAVLLFAGHLITDAAKSMSVAIGVPLFFLGIMVAVLTCLPELNFALQAVKKKHYSAGFGDIFGNVLADSLFSIGVIAIISPIRPSILQMGLLSGILMVAGAAIVLATSRSNKSISRKEGILLVCAFIVFVLLQIGAEKILFLQ